MKTRRLISLLALLAALMTAGLSAAAEESGGAVEAIPVIQMEAIPLTDAIKNLARQTGVNFILDPRLAGPWVGADGKSGREPSVTVRWENVTAEQALGRLLQEHGLAMVANPATSIARITFTNQAVIPLPASRGGIDTNSVIPLIVMDSVPLTEAIRNLARQAQLEVFMDPALPVASGGPVTRTVSQCEVSVRWEKVTPQQALAALLDNYDLVLILDTASSSAKVVAKAQTKSVK